MGWSMKKTKYIISIMLLLLLMLLMVACSEDTDLTDANMPSDEQNGQIHLYGEQHAVEEILEKELELWDQYYHKEGMRHLFVELSYYTGEYLNLWMESDNDDILESLFNDWQGTASWSIYVKNFYKEIKDNYPETIFHGTDIGHQYNTTGIRFLRYLEKNNLKDTQMYLLTQEAIEQGRQFYRNNDYGYRENKMTENFIREFNKLNGDSVMGIYGGAHTGFDSMAYGADTVPSMAKQLKKHYGDSIHSEDLTMLVRDIEPLRIDKISVNDKEYDASYFGKDLTSFRDIVYREYWRLENAYEDFKDRDKTGDVLPYDNYPMLIEIGQIFAVDIGKTDGSIKRSYYRSDGYIWNGVPSTEEFEVE